MKILFTLVSIDCGNTMYLNSAKRLVNEILSQTNQDVLLSTNNVDFFNDIISDNFLLRNNINESSIFNYGSEFNYNLKYHAFEDIPDSYDVIIYLDCDIKLDGWNKDSENFIINMINDYDFGATRLNCSMLGSVDEYRKTGRTLFSHKLHSYKIMENYDDSDDIMNSLLPSEHFLILKNDVTKIKRFYDKWKELNNYLQSINGSGGSWGDGFEIGISARYAGFHKTIEISHGIWDGILGFKFNGNKYVEQNIKKKINNKMEHFYNEIGENWFDYKELYEEMVLTHQDGDHFVEVGSWKGRSSCFMGVEIFNSGKKIKLDCVDTWLGSEEHRNPNSEHYNQELINDHNWLFNIFLKNATKLNGIITPFRMESITATKLYEDESLNFVFIDASHDYQSVFNDINAWYPKIKKNGFIAGHDFNHLPVKNAVNDLFNQEEIKEKGSCWIVQKK